MSYECVICEIAWAPYHCSAGTCPLCGAGTKRRNAKPSPQAEELYRTMVHERVERERVAQCYERFAAFYESWDARAKSEVAHLEALYALEMST
jgi:hypothetical protein